MGKPSRAGPDEVSLGWIVGVFGVRGEVRLHLHNRSSQLLRGGQMVDLLGVSNAADVAALTERDMQKLSDLRGWSPQLVDGLVATASRAVRRRSR